MIIKNVKLISENISENLLSKKQKKEVEQHSKKKNINVYLTFKDFLESTNIDVQSFEYDWKNHTINIIGYDESDKPSSVCVSISFSFTDIECFWNEKREIN